MNVNPTGNGYTYSQEIEASGIVHPGDWVRIDSQGRAVAVPKGTTQTYFIIGRAITGTED